MLLGQRIAERLDALGMSQAELARRVGVRQSTMNGLVNGRSQGTKHLHQIARELQTTPEYLSGESDDPDTGSEDILSFDDREWLRLVGALTPAVRTPLMQMLREMVRVQQGGRSSTLHDPSSEFLGFNQ
ncbi:helix-turn-helix transcriptional regulator [uncultured Croceicoccus sp.]|uniref:helix-turn-helix domain-containing protein n=1 Tax=uncultured Croceicoccus sp. TaxID=1295329 RepID=UPI002638F62B|nr:helix-turn-helix transcriptional regulator [uncultured Croceicoccus sp.]